MLFFSLGELYPQLAPHESPLNVVVSRLLWSWWFCHRRQLALGPGMTNGKRAKKETRIFVKWRVSVQLHPKFQNGHADRYLIH